MNVKELEIVELIADLPEYGLVCGARGTVVEVFQTPEQAYMVEFVDASGQSSVIADWVTARQIKNVGTGRRHPRKELLAA